MVSVRDTHKKENTFQDIASSYKLLPCQVFLNGGHERLCGIGMLNKGTEQASRYPAVPLFTK